ncbi:Fur family ferric uptake transcriptional regulator [Arcanobacterium pluranimalium]|uniref:Fur family transcriptional regulator n=1 Tax=Arcanobacterium pluranimalium TaxID=108028 RepID=UPI00195EFFC3|nr:Fur family transcriptional regulator [Arcanobacterium pluranimalium]MBM7825581.1 Fur family ferric uptake transcriptional regulator [Arcanobacterium pluranimalium]
MQRMTKQRAAIMQLLRSQSNFLSAQDLHDLLRQSGHNIGLATVYRNLQALAQIRSVDVVRQEGSDVQLFRYCSEEKHHHHLVCRTCGKTIDIQGDAVEKWAAAIADDHNFTSVTHSVELYGECAACGEKAKN